MLPRKYLGKLNTFKNCLCGSRNVSYRKYTTQNDKKDQENQLNLTLGEIGTKYQVFRDVDSKQILDVHEERFKYPLEEESEKIDPFHGINLQRGVNGVFEIEDLVEVLKRDNGEDIFVAEVPADVKYVRYMCIVTGKSYRHMVAIAGFVRRVYKQKRQKNDAVPKLEGEESKDWMAIDLGNIALHIFSRDARRKYDLDTLWAVGPEYDTECHKQDALAEMLEKHSIYLKDLQPAG